MGCKLTKIEKGMVHPTAGWEAYSLLQSTMHQTLGIALGFPWYKDDQKNFPGATTSDGICPGEYIAEDFALMAATRINVLTAQVRQQKKRIEKLRLALAPFAYYNSACVEPNMTNPLEEISMIDSKGYALIGIKPYTHLTAQAFSSASSTLDAEYLLEKTQTYVMHLGAQEP